MLRPSNVAAPFGVAELLHVADHAVEQSASAFGMLALPAAELHDELDLRAVSEEFDCAVALPRVVVVADLRSQPHLLERHVHLVASARSCAPLLFEAPLAVVHDAADRRLCTRGHLDEVEIPGGRIRPRLVGRHDTELLSFIADQAYLAHADLLVDPCGHPWWPHVRRWTAALSHRAAAVAIVFSN